MPSLVGRTILTGFKTHLRAWSRAMPVKTKNLRYSPATNLLKSLLWTGQIGRGHKVTSVALPRDCGH